MPKFLDHHKLPMMDPEKKTAFLEQIRSQVASHKADSNGVTILNVFMGDGQLWGYSDAPNAGSVVKSHEQMGMKISAKDVTEVTPVA